MRGPGLPLAIELTAARTKLLSPAAILARIGQALDHASSDRSREARHVSLRSTIAWSVDLLNQEQRTVLEALGVFEGGASFAAVEAVIPDGGIGSDVADVLFDLVDASLVQAAEGPDGEPRVDLLQTVRRFVRERAYAEGTLLGTEQRHGQWCYDLAASHWAEREDAGASLRHAVLAELDNFRAVTERSPAVHDPQWYGGARVPPLHVVVLLAAHAFAVRRYRDAIGWLESALADPAHEGDVAGRAGALSLLAQVRRWGSDFERTARDAERALAVVDQVPTDAALPPWVAPDAVRLLGLYNLGSASFVLGDPQRGLATIDAMKAMSREPGDDAHQSALEGQIFVGVRTGNYAAAREALLELSAVSGGDVGWRRSMVANSLADLDVREGDYVAAQVRLARESETTLAWGDIEHVLIQCETLAEAVGLRHPLAYARVQGSAAATREREGLTSTHEPEAELAVLDTRIRALVPLSDFAAAEKQGRQESIVDLFRELAALPAE